MKFKLIIIYNAIKKKYINPDKYNEVWFGLLRKEKM